jgi:hypothetical protein
MRQIFKRPSVEHRARLSHHFPVLNKTADYEAAGIVKSRNVVVFRDLRLEWRQREARDVPTEAD